MYRCDRCKKLSEPGESVNKVVVEKREKKYFKVICPVCKFESQNHELENCPKCIRPVKLETALMGIGWEIAKEINCCKSCTGEV